MNKNKFTTFDIKDIPSDLKTNFKEACRANGTTMKDEVTKFMKSYITQFKILQRKSNGK